MTALISLSLSFLVLRVLLCPHFREKGTRNSISNKKIKKNPPIHSFFLTSSSSVTFTTPPSRSTHRTHRTHHTHHTHHGETLSPDQQAGRPHHPRQTHRGARLLIPRQDPHPCQPVRQSWECGKQPTHTLELITISVMDVDQRVE